MPGAVGVPHPPANEKRETPFWVSLFSEREGFEPSVQEKPRTAD